jgi:hypothetical protein
MTADVPRLDYLGSSCPRLLLEPQRTNLALYSEQFDNAGWGKTGVGVTANNSTSPDGNTNADKLFNSVGTTGFASQTISLVSSTIYSGSVFAKNAGRDSLFVLFSGSGGNASCTFDLTTLTTTPSGGVTAKIEDYGGGWYRCSVVFTATSTGATAFRIYPSSTTGDGTSGAFVWGAQLEEGSYPTSYIPTLGTSVTRVADDASKTGITSLIGQTEGTLFAEIDFQQTEPSARFIAIGDGTVLNRISLFTNASNDGFRVLVSNGGITQVDSSFAVPKGVVKFALGYSNNDYIFYVDGVSKMTDTSATVPACSNVYLGRQEISLTNVLGSGINQALLFKTRLSNTELAQITTL